MIECAQDCSFLKLRTLFLYANKSFQMDLWNKSSSGNNSSLPASISNIRTYLAKGEKKAKFAEGPTISRPGPILLMVAATAVNPVIRSVLSKIPTEQKEQRR